MNISPTIATPPTTPEHTTPEHTTPEHVHIPGSNFFYPIAERIVKGEPISKVTIGATGRPLSGRRYNIVDKPPCPYVCPAGLRARARSVLDLKPSTPAKEEIDRLNSMLMTAGYWHKRAKLENRLAQVKGVPEDGNVLGGDLPADEKAMLDDMVSRARRIAAAGHNFSAGLATSKQNIKEQVESEYSKMPADSLEEPTRVATILQARIRKARDLTSDAEKENLANKKTIEQHMQWIQHNTLFSFSAHLVNARPDIAAIKVAKGVKERQFEQTMLDNGGGYTIKSGEYERLRTHFRHQVSQDGYDKLLEPYVGYLNGHLRAKALVCDDMARLVALRIRNDPSLPEALRKETRVCRMGSHIMCCVGDPKVSTSLIVDPWSYYLDYVPKAPDGNQNIDKAATRLVEAQMGERGFLGTVEQYREFIGQRPSLIGTYPEVDGTDPRRNENIQVADYNIEVDPIGQYIVENMTPEHIAQINLALPEGEELKLMAH